MTVAAWVPWLVVGADTGLLVWLAWWVYGHGTNGNLARLTARVHELTDLVSALSGELQTLQRVYPVSGATTAPAPARAPRREAHARNVHSLVIGIAAFVAELLQQGHVSTSAVGFGLSLMVVARALGAAVRAVTQTHKGGE